MDEEVKKAYLSWAEKYTYENVLAVFETFLETDQALVECENQLNKVGLGIGYTSQLDKQQKLQEDRGILRDYIYSLLDYVETKIDKPLCENFRLNATERISRISLDDFEVENTLGLTETVCPMREGIYVTRVKGKLTFADFIGTSEGNMEIRGNSRVVTNGKVEGFSAIFVSQYEAYKALGIVEEGVTWQEY